eukprot:9452121-Pyramimonas_sp.AAC.1
MAAPRHCPEPHSHSLGFLNVLRPSAALLCYSLGATLGGWRPRQRVFERMTRRCTTEPWRYASGTVARRAHP